MRWARWQGFGLAALAALCIVRLWLMPLGSSFWIDEIGTVFVVRMGGQHPSLAVAPQVPASIYFWLPRMVQWLLNHAPGWANGAGFLEASYRLPSLCCMAVATWLIAQVAARALGARAGWFAAFACLAMRGFDYQADDARPYALGTLVAVSAVYFLIRWLDAARWMDAALFVLAAALLWRVHLVYWPFYAVFVAYAAVRVTQTNSPVSWRAVVLVFGLIGALLVPVLWSALALFKQAGAHVIVALPGKSELWRSLKAGLIACCGCGAWALQRFGRRGAASRVATADWVLIVSWWLVQPLALFAFSWLTGSSVFVDRYLTLALPGAALMATACAALFLSERQWSVAAIILGCGVVLVLGNWREAWPEHHNSDWRGAAQAINALPDGRELPLLVPSPFIEAREPAWTPSYPLPGFLYAHLLVYPVVGRPVLLPFEGGYDRMNLSGAKRLVLYGSFGAIRDAQRWLAGQSQFAGWRSRSLGNFGDVKAILVEAP